MIKQKFVTKSWSKGVIRSLIATLSIAIFMIDRCLSTLWSNFPRRLSQGLLRSKKRSKAHGSRLPSKFSIVPNSEKSQPLLLAFRQNRTTKTFYKISMRLLELGKKFQTSSTKFKKTCISFTQEDKATNKENWYL